MFGSPAYPLPRDDLATTLANTMLESESNKNQTLGFSEVMSGFIHAGPDIGNFEAATKLAQSRCEAARVFLDVKSWDVTKSEYFSGFDDLIYLTDEIKCSMMTFIRPILRELLCVQHLVVHSGFKTASSNFSAKTTASPKQPIWFTTLT